MRRDATRGRTKEEKVEEGKSERLHFVPKKVQVGFSILKLCRNICNVTDSTITCKVVHIHIQCSLHTLHDNDVPSSHAEFKKFLEKCVCHPFAMVREGGGVGRCRWRGADHNCDSENPPPIQYSILTTYMQNVQKRMNIHSEKTVKMIHPMQLGIIHRGNV